MEIRFPAADAPHWLGEIVFSRVGDDIQIEIVNQSNVQKAVYLINVVRFNQVADFLLSEPGA
jgi:hypothetical protein